MTTTVSFGDAAPHNRGRGEIVRLPLCGKTYSPNGLFSFESGMVSFLKSPFLTPIHECAAGLVSAGSCTNNVSRGSNSLVTKCVLRVKPAGFTTNRFQLITKPFMRAPHAYQREIYQVYKANENEECIL